MKSRIFTPKATRQNLGSFALSSLLRNRHDSTLDSSLEISVEMRHKIFGTLAAYLAVATAFKDASPYLLLSTAECALFPFEADIQAKYYTRPPPALQESSSRQIQASADILEATKNFLNACPSDTYIIVRQPMVHAEDLSNTKAVPNLRRAMSNKSLRTKFSISEVVGEIDPEEMKDYLVSNCQAGFISVDGSSIVDSSYLMYSKYADFPL